MRPTGSSEQLEARRMMAGRLFAIGKTLAVSRREPEYGLKN